MAIPTESEIYYSILPIIDAYKEQDRLVVQRDGDSIYIFTRRSFFSGSFIEALASYCRAHYVGWRIYGSSNKPQIVI